MRKTQPGSRGSSRAHDADEASLTVSQLERLKDSYLLAGDIERHSERTLDARRDLLSKLVWFLRQREYASCGLHELRAFLHYVTHGHKEPGGRWGNPRNNRPTKPRTVKNYHGILRAFFNWCVAEGDLAESPIERIAVPVDRPDQVQPFSLDEVRKLLAAAKRSQNPQRDGAILALMFDTGLRASEVCSLRVLRALRGR